MSVLAIWLRQAGLLAVAVALFALTPARAHQHEPHAPAAEQQQTDTTAAPADEPVMTMPWPTAPVAVPEAPKTFSERVVSWLGGWHPAVIHFPIALLLTVAFLEAMAVIRRKPLYTASNKLLLAIATLGAFVAAPLGWANAGLPAADDETALVIHRWLGTVLPFLMLVLWWLKPKAEEAAVRAPRGVCGTVLTLAVLAILAQAYFGAEVTHGAGHMAF
jgi:uncharacterized membrane protein